MSFPVKLAWTYFRSARKGLVRFTAWVAIIGIAAGVGSLIVAQALAKGFSDEISGKILTNTAHISVSENGGVKISNRQVVKKTIEAIRGVERVEPTVYENAVISGGERSGYALLKVKSEARESQPVLGSDRKDGDQIRIFLGRELAKKLDLKTGAEVNLITVGANEKPESAAARVGGIFETGLYEYDATWIYISAPDYLTLKRKDKFSPKVFNVFVSDIFDTGKITEEIKLKLGGSFEVIDWREANKPLFAALSLEKKVAFAIILLIIFIAVLNIATTLTLLVNERKLDIAVLRTCGAKSGSIVLVFLIEGVFLSLAGIFAGAVLGLAACFIGNHFRVIRLSTEVYSINSVPFNVDFSGILNIICVTFLAALAAVLLPSIKASKIKPLENIRTN
ncbi:MAG: FtsX-like permease family protein [Pyrinomonadaceae bacterium]